ncbi:hypothetical protein TCARB_0142 [Thermofilum adornatum 1505]|uniref:Uncharacterized protein n=1 Tax=Thermofilum adornatum 1505 TaxID=697581 RepID=A0A3G1A4B3_9CREN|nr:hypothetical protein TCARB_0142 [Thermofilum adornatum 1505]
MERAGPRKGVLHARTTEYSSKKMRSTLESRLGRLLRVER